DCGWARSGTAYIDCFLPFDPVPLGRYANETGVGNLSTTAWKSIFCFVLAVKLAARDPKIRHSASNSQQLV
ncbi:MAG: hypothetical protein J0G97_19170, partial [Rhizobium pusense]|nr:hypothetical protein [Agrobacterium pusense]